MKIKSIITGILFINIHAKIKKSRTWKLYMDTYSLLKGMTTKSFLLTRNLFNETVAPESDEDGLLLDQIKRRYEKEIKYL